MVIEPACPHTNSDIDNDGIVDSPSSNVLRGFDIPAVSVASSCLDDEGVSASSCLSNDSFGSSDMVSSYGNVTASLSMSVDSVNFAGNEG